MNTRLLVVLCTAAVLSLVAPVAQAATIEGARINNMACDNFYFNVVAGPTTVRIDKFAVYAYHQESTRYYVYYHPGEFTGTENDASAWNLVSSASVKPTGWDTLFELSAGGTFIAAGQTGAFLICADLANDNGALWGGADGELSNGDLTVTTGRWLTRLNETAPKHFATSGECSASHGFGGVVTYEVVAATRAPRITNAPPASVALTEGEILRLEVGVEGTGPFAYQWRKGAENIPNATNALFTKLTALGDAGSYSVSVTGAVAPSATSGSTVVTVAPDRIAPSILGVSSDGLLTNVVVRFSEPVDAFEAVNTARYSLSGGLSITGAEIDETGDNVTLATSRLNSFTPYALQAGDIPDRSAAGNRLPSGTRVSFTTPSFTLNAPTTGNIFANWGNAYFNVIAGARDVTLLSLAIVGFHDADTDYLLYTRAGEYAGVEFQADAWTLIASNRLAASLIPIPRPLAGFTVRIPAGKTQAFLVTHTFGGGTLYTGAGEIATDDFTLSVGKNFTRSGEGIFDGGDETGDPAFAGNLGFCFEVCQVVVTSPSLAIRRDGNEWALSWSATGFVLQASPALGPASWTDVAGPSPVRVPVGPGNRFFRLISR